MNEGWKDWRIEGLIRVKAGKGVLLENPTIMKNLILSLAAFFLLGFCFAQESKFTYGVFLSPETQFVELTGTNLLGGSYETQHRGISAGLMGQYALTSWLSLESGLVFRHRTYRNDISEILLPDGLDPWGNTTFTSVYDKVNYTGLSLPLHLAFKAPNGWGAQVGVGFDLWSRASRIRGVTEGVTDDPILFRDDAEINLNRVGFNASLTKSIPIKNFRWEIGPQFSATFHDIAIPYGYTSQRQYSLGLRSLFWFR
jgi:hypothetical protein